MVFLEFSWIFLEISKKILSPEAARSSPKLPPKPRKLPDP